MAPTTTTTTTSTEGGAAPLSLQHLVLSSLGYDVPNNNNNNKNKTNTSGSNSGGTELSTSTPSGTDTGVGEDGGEAQQRQLNQGENTNTTSGVPMSNELIDATDASTIASSEVLVHTQEDEEPTPHRGHISSNKYNNAGSRQRNAATVIKSTAPTTTTTEWIHSSFEDSTNDLRIKEWIDQWTVAGLSRYVSLPMICVLGDTSSGKSSVLSNLIGLELPSASSLTTKCPVLIQLKKIGGGKDDDDEQQHNQEARAIVDIQWHTAKRHVSSSSSSSRERKRALERQVEDLNLSISSNDAEVSQHHSVQSSSQLPLPPPPPPPPVWKKKVLYSNLETRVPQAIQQAQQVILDHRETLVAPDVIALTLYSPTCTEELTLVDLPGLVHFQHNQDASLLSQVEQVVLEYVNNPRSLLVPVVAAPTHIHNSKVLQWTREVDPSTIRTIPVLTKPDLIDPGSESDVLELIQSTTQFQHGVYMVKNRGQALLDAGASIEEGLQEEQEYFNSTLPWNAVHSYPPRLGIPALRTTLAKVLWQIMKDSLPDIVHELEQLYDKIQKGLEGMGTMYHTKIDQRKFYHALSQRLVSEVSSSLSGKGRRTGPTQFRRWAANQRLNSSPSPTNATPTKSTSLSGMPATPTTVSSTPLSHQYQQQQEQQQQTQGGASKLHAACSDFFTEIQGSSLATISSLVEGANVLVSTPKSTKDLRGELVYIDPDGKFACVDFVDAQDHTTEVLFDGIGYTAEQPDFANEEIWTDGSRVFIGRLHGLFDSLRKIPFNRIRTDPSWLNEKMAQFRTDDLACFINVDMFQQIVAEFVQEDWAPPCYKLLQTLEELLQSTLQNALHQELNANTSRYPLLRKLLQETFHRVSETLLDGARTQVQDHLDMEEHHPYTQDAVLLQAMNQARFANLRQDLELQLRLDPEKKGVGVVYDSQAIQAVLDLVFAKHQQSNWMAEQMELVLSCYGKVATQRVLDRTPQICWQTCRRLPGALQEALGCVTDDVLEHALWESPEIKERYHSLTNQSMELEKALRVLEMLRT